MRHFHLLRNTQFTPTVNIDKLWSIVSEETRKKAAASKDKAPVIDVTKAVNLYYISSLIRVISRYWARVLSPRSQSLLRLSFSPRLPRRESRKPVESAYSLLERNYQ